MSGLFVGIFYFFIIFFVIKKANKAKKNGGTQDGTGQNGTNRPLPGGGYVTPQGVEVYPNRKQTTAQQTKATSQYPTAGQGAQGTVQQKASGQEIQRKVRQKALTENTTHQPAAVEKKEVSTTEYLAEKARLDELEHKKEEMRQRVANSKYQLGAMIPDDGIVPPACKIIYCKYCGAENMLPRNHRGQWHCYFCHDDLPV